MRLNPFSAFLPVVLCAPLACERAPAPKPAGGTAKTERVTPDAGHAVLDPADAAVSGPFMDASDAGETPETRDILSRATAAISAIKAKDAHAWAAIVHPGRGVRFSPYAFVDLKADRVLRR